MFFLNFYPVYFSVNAMARDDILTLKYSGCFPLAKVYSLSGSVVRVRRKSKTKKIISIFSATATTRDAVLTLKCAGRCPLAIGIFSFWIRRLNPKQIEKEKITNVLPKDESIVLNAPLNIASMML